MAVVRREVDVFKMNSCEKGLPDGKRASLAFEASQRKTLNFLAYPYS
jgi:hypothetical protein